MKDRISIMLLCVIALLAPQAVAKARPEVLFSAKVIRIEP